MKTIALKDSPAHLEAFASLPSLVRKDPYRTGLLPAEVWKGFVMMPTPFPKEFWVVEDSKGQAVGRIGASVSPVRKGEGAIGFFEVDLASAEAVKVADELLSQAESWLKGKGASKAHGPMNFNTWFPYRFRVSEPKERFTWEPENPPQYVEFWQRRGYTILESYHSAGYGAFDEFVEKLKPSHEKAVDLGFIFRQFDSKKVMEQEVPILYDISMEGFRDNFLFEPIPFQAFQALYLPIAGKLDLSLSYIASHPDHGPVGFFFAFQDKDYAVYKTIAMKAAARGKGISNAMMYLTSRGVQERGLSKFIAAMVKSGAQSESYGKKAQLLWESRYALLTKAI